MSSLRNFLLLCATLTIFTPTIRAHDYYAPGYTYYYTTPLYCYGTNVYTWSSTLAVTSTYQPCPQTSCYEYYSRNVCCMTYFQGADGLLYQQCRCNPAVNCPAQNVLSASTTAATTTTTTPTTTTTTPTTTTTTPTTTTTTPTTTTTTPTTTTTTPTTTTTTPTTTTTTPTTTTTTPTTTTTTPTTTTPTTTTTTTSTTTTTPTTTVPPSLCQPAFRLLNGNLVNNDCAFAGISNITINSGTRVVCNAVLTTATINGTLKKTFLTSTICKNMITSAVAGTVDISIGAQNYPVQEPIFNVTDGPNGNAFITVNDRYVNLLSYLGPCQKTACTFNSATMSSKVDFNDCKIISWGAHDTRLTQGGEYEVAVKLNLFGCTSLPNLFGANTTMCFTATSGQNAFCSGDSGAPLYCRAPSNGEWILMGVSAFQAACNSTPDIKVIPFPG